MPVDNKNARSVTKSSEDKVGAEVMGASVERMETPTRGSLQDDIFLSETFIRRFADIVDQKINHRLETLVDNLEARQKEAEDRLSSLGEENVHFRNR